METRSAIYDRSKLLDPKHLPSSTSDFKPIDVRSLNIYYVNAINADELFDSYSYNLQIPNYLMIRGLGKNELLLLSPELLQSLDDDERTTAKYLSKILRNELQTIETRESKTDTFVNFLLTDLRFNRDPFLLNLQPDYKFRVANKQITSKPEFTIEKDDTVMCLDEDKHIHNTTKVSGYGQDQIAGELLACAYVNYNNADSISAGCDQTVFAIRVIGSKFTFYKAFITSSYFQSLADGFPPDEEQVRIFRYPSYNIGYDYADPSHRAEILELLVRLRERIKQ